jgi:hypothetical protein
LNLVDRLKEPSSHAGLAALALALGQIYPQYAGIAQVVAAVLGGYAFVTPDGGSQPPAPPKA